MTCQDYRKLNEGTIKNTYLLPLISELINQLKGAKYFTKLDIQWGYNNVRIKDRDQWKEAFKTKHGLFELTIMFFGMCNSPATFQAMMDDIVMNAPHFLSFSFLLLHIHRTLSLLCPLHSVVLRLPYASPFASWLLYLDMTHYDSFYESYLYLDLCTSNDSLYESSLYLAYDSYGL